MRGLRSRDLPIEWQQTTQQGWGAVELLADRVLAQLIKSVLVSLVAFAIDFAILVALTEAAGLHYLISAALSFLVGTTVSWALSVAWVFPVRRFSSKVIAAALIFFWNFGARKLVLFTASGKG